MRMNVRPIPATLLFLAVWLFAGSALVLMPTAGCSTSQQRQTVNTLYSVGQATDAAYKSFNDLVVAGKIPTNSVPSVSARYVEFQQAFSAAIVLSTLSTNAPPSPEVTAAAANLTSAINVAKSR